jgi:hypothetical protein
MNEPGGHRSGRGAPPWRARSTGGHLRRLQNERREPRDLGQQEPSRGAHHGDDHRMTKKIMLRISNCRRTSRHSRDELSTISTRGLHVQELGGGRDDCRRRARGRARRRLQRDLRRRSSRGRGGPGSGSRRRAALRPRRPLILRTELRASVGQ